MSKNQLSEKKDKYQKGKNTYQKEKDKYQKKKYYQFLLNQIDMILLNIQT